MIVPLRTCDSMHRAVRNCGGQADVIDQREGFDVSLGNGSVQVGIPSCAHLLTRS